MLFKLPCLLIVIFSILIPQINTFAIFPGEQASLRSVNAWKPTHTPASPKPSSSPTSTSSPKPSSTSKSPSSPTSSSSPKPSDSTNLSDSGYKNFVYFANWDIYNRSYHVQELPASQITHVLYAFWNVASDGTVSISDPNADLNKQFSVKSWEYDDGKTLYGSLKQLYILKKHNRHLKTLMTVGGWTYSANFPAAASTETTRLKFASDVVTYVRDLGFDGVDIDWEYPSDDTQAADFVLLLAELRKQLDNYAATNAPGYHFLITVACSAGAKNYGKIHLSEMNKYIDNWNLMAYDYSGSWDTHVGHDANLYPSSNMYITPYNTHKAITDYVNAGVTPSKILLGIPLYGRSFVGTTGLGQSFNSVGSGSYENGIWDYKVLPKIGAVEKMDSEAVASYSYDASTQTLISYDNVEVVKKKAEYIRSQSLGGAMFWEASGDKNGKDSLIGTTASAFDKLDTKENLLKYPASKYSNIVAGMPGE
ncbi:Endochitinase 42 [Golovinomyces cichoracearum]|uniref:chitinase n=1 Tax=Golovinomyces cichoracearum TaxID=62708 RepID=A0A420IYI9_9PEZI|nr:Endochitinase 42 [Golovinomyces cichoracearum]